MKPSENRLNPERRERTEAIVAKHVDALFQRIPMLCGFSVREDLEGIDVAVCTWPGYTPGQDFHDDLLEALADLAEERPEAVQLLRGRTFARAFH